MTLYLQLPYAGNELSDSYYNPAKESRNKEINIKVLLNMRLIEIYYAIN